MVKYSLFKRRRPEFKELYNNTFGDVSPAPRHLAEVLERLEGPVLRSLSAGKEDGVSVVGLVSNRWFTLSIFPHAAVLECHS